MNPSDKLYVTYVPIGNSGMNWVFGEIPTDAIDGVNKRFYSSKPFLQMHVYLNGLRLVAEEDYWVSPTYDYIEFSFAQHLKKAGFKKTHIPALKESVKI
jgi:hypothetical protein